MGEIHLIVVWQSAMEKLDAIIDDISLNFFIKNVWEIIWSEDQFSKNLTRFYGQNLPSGCDKEAHIGKGPFHAIIFLDPAPKYGVRETTKGALSVNTNVFDARQKYREWTGGGHRIHATNSPLETLHDIWLMLGRDPAEFVEGENWNGCIDSLSTDLLGAGGWQNLDVFFSTLNRLCHYIVMRNFEPLPRNYHLNSHDDIDLLVDDLEKCVHVSGGIKAFTGDHRAQYYVKIAGEMVPFDFRYVGDSYYDRNFQTNLLLNREFVRNGFYAPNPVDYFYSLLYHALIHKPVFSEDYAERLRKLAAEIDIDFDGTPSRGARLLAIYLYENDYEYVRPNDSTVFFNERWVNAFNHLRSSEPSIVEILDETNDLSTFSLELRRHCTDWASFYYLSSARPNILRPFESWLHGNILEIGSNGGAITRYLGECGGNVLALEGSPRRAAMARLRTRDLLNVNVVAGNVDQFQCDEQFDVITMIGVLENANLFTRHDNPSLWMLQRAKSLLKPNGKLIVATENPLGLKYFAGAPEDHLGKPMYGVEGRYQTDQPQTFGKATLAGMFKDAGFGTAEFLAPFPDYKLPVSIVTEAGFSCEKFDAGALAWQSVRRDPQLPPVLAFSPELVWPSVIQNGVGLDLANSFLIVAGTSEKQAMGPSILAWHFTSERYKEFCKETRFVRTDNGSIEVQYHPLGPGSTKHNHGRLLKFFIPEKAEYVQGRPLSQEIIQIVTRDGWRMEEVGAFLKHYLHILESIPSSRGIPLQIDSIDTLLPGELFDVLPQNIIVDNDGAWQIIDNEWTLNEDIFAGWLIFRSLLPLFQMVTRFGDTASDFINTPLGFFRAAFKAIDFAVTDVEIEKCAKLELEVQTEVVRRPLKYDEFLNWLQTTPLPRQNLNQALAERDDQIIHLTQAKAEHERQITSLTQAVDEHKRIIEERLSSLYSRLLTKEGELRHVSGQLEEIQTSLMWGTMTRIRGVRDRLCPDGSLNHRVYMTLVHWLKGAHPPRARRERSNDGSFNRVLNIAKTILPVSPNRKYQLGSLIFKRFGSVFQHTDSYQRWKERQPPLPQNHFPFQPSLQDPPRKPPSLVQLDHEGVEKLVPSFNFSYVEQPLVSIVIPVYNHFEYTVCCLASLLKHIPQSSFEVIIVDDASHDDTPKILPTIENIRYWRNETNLGFLQSSNKGATFARGQFLVFLNNDTQVLEGWLDELVNTFRQFSDVGLVGSKLMYPNGMLQEAGAIIKPDGSAELVGLNADPARPEYNVVREVDYCSGACLFIEAEVFKTLGGFDEIYSPCYCEDSDLAFRVRKMGKRVLYQPRSVVVHHLSVSTNDSEHAKMPLVTRNTDIFLQRWSDELKKLNKIRAIAFYLPQYHPIPENDRWWGKGFTEWTNVTKARPNFEGHYQPHLPSDLGFYDLRLPEVREEQARLARQYGISAFCYYYYWFAGKKLLNRPFDEVLQSKTPDFPFCICWANENWTRRWDGCEEEILIAQSHTDKDHAGFIADIAPALMDERYIRINGKPLVIVYRLSLMPEPKRTADLWREYCMNEGIGEIYLAYVQSFERVPDGDDPGVYGFDAAIEFPPHRYPVRAERSPRLINPEYQGLLFDYVHTSENFINRPWPSYKLFRTVMPSWDNTARRQDVSHVFVDATPERYEFWLRKMVEQTRRFHFGDERIVFINAWNEWAEGNHLEPDKRFGHEYLVATKKGLG